MKKDKVIIGNLDNIRQHIIDNLEKEGRKILSEDRNSYTLNPQLEQAKSKKHPTMIIFAIEDENRFTKNRQIYRTLRQLWKYKDKPDEKYLNLWLISRRILISNDIDGIIEKDIYIGTKEQLKEYGIDINETQKYIIQLINKH